MEYIIVYVRMIYLNKQIYSYEELGCLNVCASVLFSVKIEVNVSRNHIYAHINCFKKNLAYNFKSLFFYLRSEKNKQKNIKIYLKF